MADRNVYPVSLETFAKLVDESGYPKYQLDQERQRLTLDIKGDETILRVHVVVGKTSEDTVWYTRFLTYSLDFEPRKAGVDREKLLEWVNLKNADLIFGRYYYDDRTDTVAFELSLPCNGGLLGEDFFDLMRIATVSVDKTHGELKGLAATPKAGEAAAPKKRAPSKTKK